MSRTGLDPVIAIWAGLAALACGLLPTSGGAATLASPSPTATLAPPPGAIPFDLPRDGSPTCLPLRLVTPVRFPVNDPDEVIRPYDLKQASLGGGQPTFQLTGGEALPFIDVFVEEGLAPGDCDPAGQTCSSMTLTLCAAGTENTPTLGFEGWEAVRLEVGTYQPGGFAASARIDLPLLFRREGSCGFVSAESRPAGWLSGYRRVARPSSFLPQAADEREVVICEEPPIGRLCIPAYDGLMEAVNDNVAQIALVDCPAEGACRIANRIGEPASGELCFELARSDNLSCAEGCALAPLPLIGEGLLPPGTVGAPTLVLLGGGAFVLLAFIALVAVVQEILRRVRSRPAARR